MERARARQTVRPFYAEFFLSDRDLRLSKMTGVVDNALEQTTSVRIDASSVKEDDEYVLPSLLESHDSHVNSSESSCRHSNQTSSSSVLSSSASSFCSFDIKLWEDFYLNSLSPPPTGCDKMPEEPLLAITKGVAQGNINAKVGPMGFVGSGIPMGELRPRGERSHNFIQLDEQAEYADRGHTRVDHKQLVGVESTLPVLKVVQTGTMRIACEEVAEPKKAVTNPSLTDNRDNCETAEVLVNTHMVKGGQNTEAVGEKATSDGERKKEEAIMVGMKLVSSAQLLAETPVEFYSSPVAPLRTACCVPFKWEEVPGKPKSCAVVSLGDSRPPLQLPPRLHYRSDSALGTRIARIGSPRSNSVTPRWSCSSPNAPEIAHKNVHWRNYWRAHKNVHWRNYWRRPSFRKKAEEDAWSRITTLFGPEAGKRGFFSFSSSDSSSVLDALTEIQSGSSVAQSGHLNSLSGDESSTDEPDGCPLCEESISVRSVASASGPSAVKGGKSYIRRSATESLRRLVGLLQMSKIWRRTIIGRRRSGSFQGTESCASTSAADFHLMDLEQESNISEQFQSLDEEHCLMLPLYTPELPVEEDSLARSSVSDSEPLNAKEEELVAEPAVTVRKLVNPRRFVASSRSCPLKPLRALQGGTVAKRTKRAIRKLRASPSIRSKRLPSRPAQTERWRVEIRIKWVLKKLKMGNRLLVGSWRELQQSWSHNRLIWRALLHSLSEKKLMWRASLKSAPQNKFIN